MAKEVHEPISTHLDFNVDGFRSLRKVEFRLNHGLNVLAGPNGSGKTNVVALLDFLSEYSSNGAHAAIAKLGGAARVFSNEYLDDSSKKARLSVSINGQFPFTRAKISSDAATLLEPESATTEPEMETLKVFLSYKLELCLDKSVFSVSIAHEELRWNIDGEKELYVVYKSPNHAEVSSELHEDIIAELASVLSHSFIETMKQHYRETPLESKVQSASKMGQSIVSSVSLPPRTAGLAAIRLLAFERSFNIDPIKVRQPEDIASATPLSADGGGVITSLYSDLPRPTRSKSKKRALGKFERIVSQFSQINDSIKGLTITPDLKSGRLRASVTFQGKNTDIDIPIESISDGTAKWLAMIVIIANAQSGYCVEEPENYLHPQAQRLFLSAVREKSRDKESSIFLVTTHSETIINNSSPSELLICEYENGGTKIRRLDDSENIEKAINKTGFGLGFLYANDRL